MDNSDSRINEEQLSRAGRRRRQNNEEGLIQNNRQILYQQPPVQQQMAASVDQMYHLPHGANPQQQPTRQQAPQNMYQQYMGQQPHPQVRQQRYPPLGANNYRMGGNDFGGQNYAELAQMQQQPPQLPYQQQIQQQAPQQFAPIHNAARRHVNDRPVVRLSVHLIDTYRRINETYYENRRRREAAARAAASEAEAAEELGRNQAGHGGVHNHGFDDENYDYILRTGEVIAGRYKIRERIGRGSFGQVVLAFDEHDGCNVAIKIIKSRRPFLLQARTEIDLLTHLNEQDPGDANNIVRLLTHFMHRNHQCLVFEMLSLNLYELLRNTQFIGVSLNLIRKFAKQISKALRFLASPNVDVIHCDLKPENILLRHPKRSGIKVIDFGSSCRSNNQMYTYIQSRFYRSPEVLLGLPYSTAIDIWSLGCILVEMKTGEPLFSGSDQYDQIKKIVQILGMIPDDIIENMRDQQRNQFFERDLENRWTMRVTDAQREPVVPSTNPRESIREILRQSDESNGNYESFVDLIYRMLAYRPQDRISPADIQQHPFIIAGEQTQPR